MRKHLGVVLLGLVFGAAAPAGAAPRILLSHHGPTPASTRQVQIEIVNQAGIRPRLLRKLEDALAWQANTQLRRWWHTPHVSFTNHGWKLIIVAARRWDTVSIAQGQIDGWHSGPVPIAETKWDSSDVLDSEAVVSHELMEMLVDPSGVAQVEGSLKEVCDPVTYAQYMPGEVELTDFVTPAWYRHGSHGPWDTYQLLTHPGQINYGYRVGADLSRRRR